jgi:L-aspartate oxidase
MTVHETDVLVIGSGIAGLSFALKVAGPARVVVVTKKQRADSSTNWAQGGIAAVIGDDDRPELHVRDTLAAGAGLCHADVVAGLVRDGPARIRELIDWGVRFSEEAGGRLSLGREGGHSRRRIVHAADRTGREIERALLAAVEADPAIEVFEDHIAVDLLVGEDPSTGERRCAGALVLDRRTGELVRFHAGWTMLATGGFGRAYRHTTNPDIAVGDGVAMAYRAGAAVMNLEFVQFHPTALYPAEGRAVLISEAVRGEGAVLRRIDGKPLMEGVHPLGSLATRDVVARTIAMTLRERGDPYVHLDLSPIPAETVERRFPYIFAECLERGIDIRREPIPVVPAAHYACGGVRTDEFGRTTIAGLLAAGEVACTGVHGANRLASNSLLEAVVFSHRAAERVREEVRATPCPAEPPCPTGRQGPDPEAGTRWEARGAALRDLMWECAGIVRSDELLARAEHRLRAMKRETELEFAAMLPDARLVELRNLIETSLLVVRSARWRRESRGLHYTIDHPYRDNERYLRDTVIERRQDP